jgi:translation initiation factor IF-3
LSRPFPSRSFSTSSQVRVNGKIRAREVRVIGDDGAQLGVLSLADAIILARAKDVDLVEVAPNATPPVCRLVDFGKYRYEQNKKEKEARKHQHANKVKEVQLSPQIDPHDFAVKLSHAIDFLCEEMKVKVTLKFRGREMAHKEFGFQQVEKFTREVALYGHPDFAPRLVGKGISMMFSPLPRSKRAKNPRENADGVVPPSPHRHHQDHDPGDHDAGDLDADHGEPSDGEPSDGEASVQDANEASEFNNSPFANLDLDDREEQEQDPPQSSATGS